MESDGSLSDVVAHLPVIEEEEESETYVLTHLDVTEEDTCVGHLPILEEEESEIDADAHLEEESETYVVAHLDVTEEEEECDDVSLAGLDVVQQEEDCEAYILAQLAEMEEEEYDEDVVMNHLEEESENVTESENVPEEEEYSDTESEIARFSADLELSTCTDINTKLIMMKLADMSRDIEELENEINVPQLDPDVEEEETVSSEAPVEIAIEVEEEEEDSSDIEAVLSRLENDEDSKILLDKIDKMSIQDTNSVIDEYILEDGILKDQIEYVFRDLGTNESTELSSLDIMQYPFASLDADFCLSCLFSNDRTEGRRIDDKSWCKAQFYAGEDLEGDMDEATPEIIALLGNDTEVVEFSSFINYVTD